MAEPSCPQCNTPIEPTWDWCQTCGFDPDGMRTDGVASPAGAGTLAPGRAPGAPPGGYAPPGPGQPGFGPAPGYGTAPGYGPPGYAQQGYGPPPGYGPPGYGPPRTSGVTAFRIILLVASAFVGLAVVSILAVTFLGKSASSRFSSVGAPVPDRPQSAEWTTFTPPDKSFSVELPGQPIVKHSADLPQPPDLEATIYAVIRPEGIVEADYFEIPPGVAYDFDAAIDAVTKEFSATVASRTPRTVGTAPAIDVELSGKGQVHLIRILDLGERVYFFQVSGRTARTADFDRVVNSFKEL